MWHFKETFSWLLAWKEAKISKELNELENIFNSVNRRKESNMIANNDERKKKRKMFWWCGRNVNILFYLLFPYVLNKRMAGMNLKHFSFISSSCLFLHFLIHEKLIFFFININDIVLRVETKEKWWVSRESLMKLLSLRPQLSLNSTLFRTVKC